ncbi:S9 family peptidase [Pontibacter sp. SGAir0037]|uniref:alpha/beta hydrolase family protein n=1 Tax=Pontibacter sp. SGAir0037 TaxID=2571030 RepID=UPI0010CCCA1D|nr:alpha/beta fold hydrolase [Pontibacter sp. SGAir0037]QCR22892.1 dienelactone hydrolase [Pontibacter sp. SGAir0037]
MPEITKVNFVVYPAHGRGFTADASYIPDHTPKPVVVFVHGFKGFKDWGHFNLLSSYFAGQGFVFIKLNFSHNGTSVADCSDMHDLEAFGRNNFCLELDDLGSLLDNLHTGDTPLPLQEINLDRLYLIGHSRGGGSVILKAVEDKRVKAIATWASVSDFDQRWSPEVMEQWEKEGVQWIPNARTGQQMPLYYQIVENYNANKHRLHIPELVKNLRQPMLILHGDVDETVPLLMAHDLKKRKPDAELHILPDTNHSFGGMHPYHESTLPAAAQQAANLTISFFRKHA